MADFTEVPTWAGVVHVAFVVDVYSRAVAGWSAAAYTWPVRNSSTTMAVLRSGDGVALVRLGNMPPTRGDWVSVGLEAHADAGDTVYWGASESSRPYAARRPGDVPRRHLFLTGFPPDG